jgi:hypothetical protein
MMQSNWRAKAVCTGDPKSSSWLSYDIKDVEYAKEGCSRCPVKKECLVTAIKNNSFIGVIAGISEYDYLLHTWQEATRENESNWRTDDSILSGLLQKAL